MMILSQSMHSNVQFNSLLLSRHRHGAGENIAMAALSTCLVHPHSQLSEPDSVTTICRASCHGLRHEDWSTLYSTWTLFTSFATCVVCVLHLRPLPSAAGEAHCRCFTVHSD